MNIIEIDDSSESVSSFTEFLVSTNPADNLDGIYKLSMPIRKIEAGGLVLYHEDLMLLRPNRWLNDRVINAYFEVLAEAYDGVYAMSTYIYPSLRNENIVTIASWFDGENLVRWEYILVPIHENNHWTLIVVNGNTMEYYDSLGGINRRSLKMVRNLLSEIHVRHSGIPLECRVKLMNNKFHQQKNSDDCGVFCCMLAKYRISPYLKEVFTAEDTGKLRKQMLHELLANEIIYK